MTDFAPSTTRGDSPMVSPSSVLHGNSPPPTMKKPKGPDSPSTKVAGFGIAQKIRDLESCIQTEILTARQEVQFLEGKIKERPPSGGMPSKVQRHIPGQGDAPGDVPSNRQGDVPSKEKAFYNIPLDEAARLIQDCESCLIEERTAPPSPTKLSLASRMSLRGSKTVLLPGGGKGSILGSKGQNPNQTQQQTKSGYETTSSDEDDYRKFLEKKEKRNQALRAKAEKAELAKQQQQQQEAITKGEKHSQNVEEVLQEVNTMQNSKDRMQNNMQNNQTRAAGASNTYYIPKPPNQYQRFVEYRDGVQQLQKVEFKRMSKQAEIVKNEQKSLAKMIKMLQARVGRMEDEIGM